MPSLGAVGDAHGSTCAPTPHAAAAPPAGAPGDPAAAAGAASSARCGVVRPRRRPPRASRHRSRPWGTTQHGRGARERDRRPQVRVPHQVVLGAVLYGFSVQERWTPPGARHGRNGGQDAGGGGPRRVARVRQDVGSPESPAASPGGTYKAREVPGRAPRTRSKGPKRCPAGLYHFSAKRLVQY